LTAEPPRRLRPSLQHGRPHIKEPVAVAICCESILSTRCISGAVRYSVVQHSSKHRLLHARHYVTNPNARVSTFLPHPVTTTS